MATVWGIIADIPAKVLINNILPLCEAKDVLSLGCTNKFFALIATDETFWRQKVVVDYNFRGSEIARRSGWKFIYQRFRKPRVFIWGCVTLSSCYEAFIHSLMHSCLLIWL